MKYITYMCISVLCHCVSTTGTRVGRPQSPNYIGTGSCYLLKLNRQLNSQRSNILNNGQTTSAVCCATFFFTGLFFYVYIESPNLKNPEGPTPQAPNPIN